MYGALGTALGIFPSELACWSHYSESGLLDIRWRTGTCLGTVQHDTICDLIASVQIRFLTIFASLNLPGLVLTCYLYMWSDVLKLARATLLLLLLRWTEWIFSNKHRKMTSELALISYFKTDTRSLIALVGLIVEHNPANYSCYIS